MVARVVAALFAFVVCATQAAERIEVRYRLGEAETAVSARAGAMTKLRLAALPHAGQHVRGHLRLHDDQLSERIDHLAEAAISVRDLVETWESDGPDRYLRIEASVSIDQAALDRFHAAASITAGVTSVPLDEHLLAAEEVERELHEKEAALIAPWLSAVFDPLIATPVELEVIEILPGSDRHARARVRVRWTVPQAVLGPLCRRLLCSPQGQGRVAVRAPVPPEQVGLPPATATDQAFIIEWLHRTNVYVTLHLGNRFLADAPLLDTPPEPVRPASLRTTQFQLGGLVKTLHVAVDTEITVFLPRGVLTTDPVLHAAVKMHSLRR